MELPLLLLPDLLSPLSISPLSLSPLLTVSAFAVARSWTVAALGIAGLAVAALAICRSRSCPTFTLYRISAFAGFAFAGLLLSPDFESPALGIADSSNRQTCCRRTSSACLRLRFFPTRFFPDSLLPDLLSPDLLSPDFESPTLESPDLGVARFASPTRSCLVVLARFFLPGVVLSVLGFARLAVAGFCLIVLAGSDRRPYPGPSLVVDILGQLVGPIGVLRLRFRELLLGVAFPLGQRVSSSSYLMIRLTARCTP